MAYHKTVLKNGLRVVSENQRGGSSISVGLWVEVGARHETAKLAGISHFLEHMVFKGTRTRTAKQLALSLETLGGSLNAFTGREQTCFYARVLSEHLPRAIDVLADLLVNPRLRAADIGKERQVIAEEIKDVEDAPADLVHDISSKNLWAGHPLGRPIMGSLRSVRRIARKDIQDHLHNRYTPARIVVAAAGNLDHDRLVRLVRRHCRFVDYGSEQVPERPPSVATIRNSAVSRDLNQAHVCLGLRAIPFHDHRRYALLILNNLLGGGMSSRLFQTIREQHGLVYSIYAFHDFFSDAGMFGVYFGTAPRQVAEATDLVLREFREVKKRCISTQVLHDVVNQIKGNFQLSMEAASNRMHRLARHEILWGKPISSRHTMAAFERVTAREIRDLAHEIFAPDNLSVTIIGAVNGDTIRNLDWGKLN